MINDDQIATIHIDYAGIKRDFKGHMEPQWVYAYGAPLGEQSSKYAKRMNEGKMEGAAFRGKLLMECKVEEKEKRPNKKRIHDINDLKDDERPKMIEYYLRADLYEGTEINKT